MDKGGYYDLERAKPKDPEGPVQEKAIVIRKDSRWLFDETPLNKIRLATILLTALNFSIEVPSIEKVYSKKCKNGRPSLANLDLPVPCESNHMNAVSPQTQEISTVRNGSQTDNQGVDNKAFSENMDKEDI